MARIAVVADSTCDMGPAALEALGVTMVPLKVHFGDETYRDWIDLTPSEFYPKLAEHAQALPTTSQPSPAAFSEVYQRLADEGADGIVSIHLSSHLSGTLQSAELAAKNAAVPVRAVDSLFVSWAMALIVQAACAARDAGGDLDAVEQAALRAISGTELYFLLDTLDNLVKGGRAGKAQGLAASLLNIKPVLRVNEGVVEPFSKTRGTKAAMQQLATHVIERSQQLGGVKAVVIHALAPELAETMVQSLRDGGLAGEIAEVGEIGAVIGTYAGLHAVGVTYMPVA